MKIFKYSVIALCIVFAIGFVIIAAMIIKQNMVDIMTDDNVNSLAYTVKYRNPVKAAKEFTVIRQKRSCGYACIEMLSEYLDSELITEESLYEANGKKITASTTGGFFSELTKQFPGYKITQYKNLKNSELIDKIYESLKNGMPVICAYAAVDKQDENANANIWTVHSGIVVGMDLREDEITVVNPYGYTEIYTLNDFLKATRFESYENMGFSLNLGFAAEIYTKNTVYIIEDKTEETAEKETTGE